MKGQGTSCASFPLYFCRYLTARIIKKALRKNLEGIKTVVLKLNTINRFSCYGTILYLRPKFDWQKTSPRFSVFIKIMYKRQGM
jgi:hypothetical protein